MSSVSEPGTHGYRYDAGFGELLSQGFDRYLLPSEIVALIHEHPALASPGYDWTDMAWEVNGSILTAHVHPRGLAWQEYIAADRSIKYKYRTPAFTSKEKRTFSLARLRDSQIHPLSEFDSDFAEFHFGKHAKDDALIYLPPEAFLVPVAYSYMNALGHIGCYGHARGIRSDS